ncbi:hypothetical protein SAMN02746098_00249 [Desulfosporosinus lacus DSM 15449]|uniref:Uncharacterized protein n=1 Tax=Desulfosporosinus lacus DSM 15449 TaxID=1121420 RepID=A0A1M5QFN6_9FIRM|nr:hypothetical protein SAMN02746098_00249 [Desulfosporosinus lacus DSM 15449]
MVFDWFNLSLWLFALISGISLLILSGSKRYIDWIKERMPMSEARTVKMEKKWGYRPCYYIIIKFITSSIKTLTGGRIIRSKCL